MTTTDPLAADRTSNADTQPHELTPAQLVELTELLTQERAALEHPPAGGRRGPGRRPRRTALGP